MGFDYLFKMGTDFFAVGAPVAPDAGDQAGGSQNQDPGWQLVNNIVNINE